MRLINTKTGQFEEFQDLEKAPTYAILSHTWRSQAEGGEQTYQQLREIQALYGPDGRNISTSIFRRLRSILSRPHKASSSTKTAGWRARDPPSKPRAQFNFSIWGDPELSQKIREACRVARENGYDWIWVDSSCIDKSSSSELSEAINSMYLWYGRARVCYAFLADVPAKDDHRAEGSRFRRSKWFRRGWTLQELIAPLDVVFFSDDWTRIGSKHTLQDLVEDITGISYKALLHLESLDKFSVAQRFSWASRRKTTREEDRAYSLLGIFDINMPTLYGEGDRAFRRLQEEIMRRIPDQSLFAWGDIYLGSEQILRESAAIISESAPEFSCHNRSSHASDDSDSSILAASLTGFGGGLSIEAVSHNALFSRLDFPTPLPEYTSIPHGIRMQIPMISLSHYLPLFTTGYPSEVPRSQWYLVILGCEHKDFPGHLLGRVCYIPPSDSSIEFLHSGCVEVDPQASPWNYECELFPLSPATIERCRSKIELKTVYIPHPHRGKATSEDIRRRAHKTIDLMLAKETRGALRDQGYTADLRGPDQDNPTGHCLTLSNDEHTITVEYQHILENYGRNLAINAHVRMLRSVPNSAGDDVHHADASEVVSWSDSAQPWRASLGNTSVTMNAARRRPYTITLGFNHLGLGVYLLHVELQ